MIEASNLLKIRSTPKPITSTLRSIRMSSIVLVINVLLRVLKLIVWREGGKSRAYETKRNNGLLLWC